MFKSLLHKHWHLNVLIFVLGSVLLFAFWLRIQGVNQVPAGQFTGSDAYLYYWQAEIVSEHGQLPERDMHRWLPFGRDLGQTLNLYSYSLAYAYKVLALCFPNISLYLIAVYAPTICFLIALSSLCFFLYRTYGLLFSCIVGLLLATFLGTINRSSAGFGDRDSWCLMLGILAITTYLASLQAQSARLRILWTLTSGFIVFLGGLSWEGFGFFVAMILAVELWKFCTTKEELHLKTYVLWGLMFVPMLYLISPAYRSGYGFSTHVAPLMLFPPLVIFTFRGVRALCLNVSELLRSYARHLAWFLTLISLAIGVCYIAINLDTFAFTAYPFRENRLMRTITELADPRFSHWGERYGSAFVLGSLGLVIESFRLWKWKGSPLGVFLSLFVGTTFFRWPISEWVGSDICDLLFYAALVLVPIGLGIASLRKEKPDNEPIVLLIIVWFLLWVALARHGKRYDFFIGVPLAFGTASLFCLLPTHLAQTLKLVKRLPSYFRARWLTICITIVMFVSVLFWEPVGGHVTGAVQNASQIRSPMPGRGEIADTFRWLKTTLHNSAVVAANWDYGSQLNVLGGVKTIIDQDHYIPHWVHLYYRHVFCAQSEQEALSFLKTHGATHLMIMQREVIRLSRNHSFIGSDVNSDRLFRLSKLQRNLKNSTEIHYWMIPQRGTPLESVEITVLSPQKRLVTVQFKSQDTVSKEVVWNAKKPSEINLGNSGVILYFDFEGKPYIGYYIPPLGWNSLAVKLFMRGDHSRVFELVYPTREKTFAEVKVWKIDYPPDIKTEPRFLETEAGESLR